MIEHVLNPYPLEGGVHQWQPFIEQATTHETFLTSSLVLKALAREAGARMVYAEAWKDYEQGEQEQKATFLCYNLCEVLNQFTEASQAWLSVATYLDSQLREAGSEYLQELHKASVHDFQRVSFLHFSVQNELQQVANRHKILLAIGVLENQEEVLE